MSWLDHNLMLEYLDMLVNMQSPILVVDDDKLVRLKIKRMLEKESGATVVLAKDGQEAWDILCDHPEIQFVITDWMMPRMTGPELCNIVKTTANRAFTYLILATAKESNEDLAEGMDSGANDYVKKPIDNVELLARVRSGMRIVELERTLQLRKEELEKGILAAESVQQGTLPSTEQLAEIKTETGISIAYKYIASESLGGDLLGAATIELGKLVVFLGDVSGHGVPSSLSAVSLHSYLQTCICSTSDPYKILKLANEYCYSTFPADKYATLVLICIDYEYSTAELMLAGHPPLLQVHSDGETVLHDKSVPGVGMWPDPPDPSDVIRFKLRSGDKLIAYTDGVTEARNDVGEMYSESNLLNLVAAEHAASIEELTERILADVDRWQGDPESRSTQDIDDLTLVAIEYRKSEKC